MTGVAVVGAVSLGFFAVGRSEDRAREAETQARDPQPDAEARATGGSAPARRRGHVARSRGDS